MARSRIGLQADLSIEKLCKTDEIFHQYALDMRPSSATPTRMGIKGGPQRREPMD